MSCTKLAYAIGVVLMLCCVRADAIEFSIDGASPEVPLPFVPADVVLFDGTGVRIPAADLGLIATDEIDGFSTGSDDFSPGGPNNWTLVLFSVTRGTVGTGGAVAAQAAGNGAAGDKFILAILAGGIPPIAPIPLSDAPMHGLTPLPAPQSDLDGLSASYNGFGPVYMTVDVPTAVRLGVLPTDILIQPAPGPAAAPPAVWARGGLDLGLLPGDVIDALAVNSLGGPVFGPLDRVWVSLAPGSPTLPLLGSSPAALIQVAPGPPAVLLPPIVFGLGPADDLNAIAAGDPGPQLCQPGPGPGPLCNPGACCLPGGGCDDTLSDWECQARAGQFNGAGTMCLGDNNGNGIDDACEQAQGIPTVSEWGLIVMTLLLLTAGTIVIGRRRRPATA